MPDVRMTLKIRRVLEGRPRGRDEEMLVTTAQRLQRAQVVVPDQLRWSVMALKPAEAPAPRLSSAPPIPKPIVAARELLLAIAAVGAGWLRAIWFIVKHPILSVPIVVYVGLVIRLGEHDAGALITYAVIVLIAWRLAHKPSYQRLVGRRLRSSWRRLWVYDRRWRTAMVLSGLGKQYRLRERIPRIQSVRSEPWGDRVLMRLATGQCTEDVERVAPQLAHSCGARACRVREDRPGRLWLLFEIDDPTSEPIPGTGDRPGPADDHAIARSMHPEFRTQVVAGQVTVTGVLPDAAPTEGTVAISGDVHRLSCDEALGLVDALMLVVVQMDAAVEERYTRGDPHEPVSGSDGDPETHLDISAKTVTRPGTQSAVDG